MLNLSPSEQAMAAGEQGPAVKRALDIVCALARAAGADRLVEVASVQVAGVSYKNIGEAGLEFLEQWAAEGGRAQVPAWMNPCGADLAAWKELGYPREFISRQLRVVDALERLGVQSSLTCAPYHVAEPPAAGAHLAWSESSAVSVANSVFGARTNREGGPSALAAALCGRTPLSGYHLDAVRRATHRVRVRCHLA
ncbi:MAG TPA: aconitase X, partial [Candidatus Brocadiia bacterium]|nr:aconitase X [Candidatus Brocadiia bacterium]